MEESVWPTEYRTFKVGNSLHGGQARKTWNEVIKSDLKESKDKAKEENTWNSFIKKHPNHPSIEIRRRNKYDDNADKQVSYITVSMAQVNCHFE